jgi:hypothetical protein
MTYEYTKTQTINAILVGNDLQGDKIIARAFLQALMDQASPETLRVVLPIARRLMAYTDWAFSITTSDLISHCAKRNVALVMLQTLNYTGDCDPQAELMAGIAERLAADLGLKMPA